MSNKQTANNKPRVVAACPTITLSSKEYVNGLREAFRAGLRAGMLDDPEGAVGELSTNDDDEGTADANSDESEEE